MTYFSSIKPFTNDIYNIASVDNMLFNLDKKMEVKEKVKVKKQAIKK